MVVEGGQGRTKGSAIEFRIRDTWLEGEGETYKQEYERQSAIESQPSKSFNIKKI